MKKAAVWGHDAEGLEVGRVYVQFDYIRTNTGSSESKFGAAPQDNAGNRVIQGHCGGYNETITDAHGLVVVKKIEPFTDSKGRARAWVHYEDVEIESPEAQQWAQNNGVRIQFGPRVFAVPAE